VKKFCDYISAKGEFTGAAVKAVFKSENPQILKAYINGVFPAGSEFQKHQDKVAKYGNRKTLCTFYMYHTLETSGQIELIKRDDIRLFSYYVGKRPRLTKEAFVYLVESGKPQLVKYYLENCLSEKGVVEDFVGLGNLKYLKYYAKIATGIELEVLRDVVNKVESEEVKAKIYAECKELRQGFIG
jgi:hypothetical protein